MLNTYDSSPTTPNCSGSRSIWSTTMAATLPVNPFGPVRLWGASHRCWPGVVYSIWIWLHIQDQPWLVGDRVPWWQRRWRTWGAVMRRGQTSTSQSRGEAWEERNKRWRLDKSWRRRQMGGVVVMRGDLTTSRTEAREGRDERRQCDERWRCRSWSNCIFCSFGFIEFLF